MITFKVTIQPFELKAFSKKQLEDRLRNLLLNDLPFEEFPEEYTLPEITVEHIKD